MPETLTPAIRVFEPALCCNTGVCGPDPDQELVRFTGDIHVLQEAGADIVRVNLATDPEAFTANPVAVAFVQTAGSEGLPLTLVNDVTVLTGRYPTRQELGRWAGLAGLDADGRTELGLTAAGGTGSGGGCCGGGNDGDASEGACCAGKAEAAPQAAQPAAGCCGGGSTSERPDAGNRCC